MSNKDTCRSLYKNISKKEMLTDSSKLGVHKARKSQNFSSLKRMNKETKCFFYQLISQIIPPIVAIMRRTDKQPHPPPP